MAASPRANNVAPTEPMGDPEWAEALVGSGIAPDAKLADKTSL